MNPYTTVKLLVLTHELLLACDVRHRCLVHAVV